MSIRRVAETADVTQKSQVGNDSIVGEYTKIAEKSSVKRSIIGAHCIIGKNVKIANSIIMDHVVLEDLYVLYTLLLYFNSSELMLLSCSVKLDGCIVCSNAKVLEGSTLTKCEVAGGYIVEKKSECLIYRW